MSGLSCTRAAQLFALGLYLLFGIAHAGFLTALAERSGHGAIELLHVGSQSRGDAAESDIALASADAGDCPKLDAACRPDLRPWPLLDARPDALAAGMVAGAVALLAVGILVGPMPAPGAIGRAFHPEAALGAIRWRRTVVLLI